MATFNWGKKGNKAKGKTKIGGKPNRTKITPVNSHFKGKPAKVVARMSGTRTRSPKAPGKPVKGANSRGIKYSSKNLF